MAAPASLLDTHDVEVRTVPVNVGLNRPLRMAALGDIHYDPLCNAAYVTHIVGMLTELQPDVICYTGDFMTGSAARSEELAEILSHARAPLGSYAAIGNHEHIAGVAKVTAALEQHGIRVLRNESVPLPGHDGFYLSGLDSMWGWPELTPLRRTPADSRHILLAHEPDGFLGWKDPRIVLQIAGHTHGGQIRLPTYGPLHLPIHGRLFVHGLFAREGRFLYVNRGIGALPPFVRYDCPPEITVLELT
jgi:predicted MPP superfamily phosphohydrolase